MVEIAVLGFGTVGSGVVELLDRNRGAIEEKFPEGIHVRYILDLRDFPDSPYSSRVIHDYAQILADPEIRIVVETMGGLEPAYTFSKQALEKGISVCTSNKELVAAHGPELLKIAAGHNCSYMFEAAVGGGIPIIRPLNDALTQEYITSIVGILNGTTNYMMTRMENEGISYEDCLQQAQENGYAERHPEADVEGHDACRKIAILSSLMCGKTVRYEDIPCEGITEISTADFGYARKMGMAVKLLGTSRRGMDGTFYVRTAPFLVPKGHPLYGVEDVFNAVFLHGNMVDNLMFYGRGAGKFPTASAVAADICEEARTLGRNVPCRWDDAVMELTDAGTEIHRFFVRISSEEKSAAEKLFGSVKFVESDLAPQDETAFITDELSEEEFAGKASQLSTMKIRIRLLDD